VHGNAVAFNATRAISCFGSNSRTPYADGVTSDLQGATDFAPCRLQIRIYGRRIRPRQAGHVAPFYAKVYG